MTRVSRRRQGEGGRAVVYLEADDVPLLPLHVEVVELVELDVEDPGEPVPQGDIVPVSESRGGGGGRRRGRGRVVGVGGQGLDELLEGLVCEVLVLPVRQRPLQVVPEILAELHGLDSRGMNE